MANRKRLKNVEAYREKERIRQKDKRAKIREFVNLLKANGCVDCGTKHPAVLQFHHLDASTKVKSINRLIATTTSHKRVSEEAAKCVVVCANFDATLVGKA